MAVSAVLGSNHISADPIDILLHYALGLSAVPTRGEGSRVAWVRFTHHGVHLLRNIDIPKSQMRYVFSPKFEIRYDTAFDEVLLACADISRNGHTWIVPELIEGYTRLYEMGFAHSFEAWHEGKLAGGCFGVHMGSFITVESMFYRVSNASKAAYGQTLVRLKERGFTLVESNPVDDVSRNYGEEWIPQWRYEELLAEAIDHPAGLTDDCPAPPLPAGVRRMLPLARVVRKLGRKITRLPLPARQANPSFANARPGR
jgi:leucyl/phenylalanyl-tRNA--protein transferase